MMTSKWASSSNNNNNTQTSPPHPSCLLKKRTPLTTTNKTTNKQPPPKWNKRNKNCMDKCIQSENYVFTWTITTKCMLIQSTVKKSKANKTFQINKNTWPINHRSGFGLQYFLVLCCIFFVLIVCFCLLSTNVLSHSHATFLAVSTL